MATEADYRAMGMAPPGAKPTQRRDLSGLSFEQQWLEEECTLEKILDGKIVGFCADLVASGHRVLTYHPYRSTKSEPGYPDRAILIPGWLWMLELKVGDNHATPAQFEWLGLFSRLPSCTAMVVYPKDWPAVASQILERLNESC